MANTMQLMRERLFNATTGTGGPISVVTLDTLLERAATGVYDASFGYDVPRILISDALQVPTVWRCVEVISNHIASLCMQVHVPEGKGMVVEPEHPLNDLFGEAGQPFPDWTRFELFKWVITSLLLQGNAFLMIVRRAGKVVGLRPLDHARMTLSYDDMGMGIKYTYNPGVMDNHRVIEIAPRDIVHLRGMRIDTDTPYGVSTVAYAAARIRAARLGGKLADSMWANYNRPDFVLSTDGRLEDEDQEKMQERLNEVKGEAGHVMMLEFGLKPMAVSMNASDAQFLESRKFNNEEIARMFGVPPFMLNETERSTSWGTGLESQYKGFKTATLMPWMHIMQGGFTSKLLHPDMPGREVLRFDTTPLLNADSRAKMEYLARGAQWGFLSPNEAREMLDMPPRPDGDIYYPPPNAGGMEDMASENATANSGGTDHG